MTAPDLKSSNELSAERTEMSVSRTMMSADRTLLSWIRTSLSLLSFGFTIYKLLQGFQAGGVVLRAEDSPRRVALFLAVLGAAAIRGTFVFLAVMRDLKRLHPVRLLRPSLVMAIIMGVANLSLFFGILTKAL